MHNNSKKKSQQQEFRATIFFVSPCSSYVSGVLGPMVAELSPFEFHFWMDMSSIYIVRFASPRLV